MDTLTISSGVPMPHYWFFGWNPQDCFSFLATLTDDSHSGDRAVELETTLCQWSINSGSLGITANPPDTTEYISDMMYGINARPDQLSFYYKFNPVNGDTAHAVILLYNYPDSVTFMDPYWYSYHDTIGFAEHKIIGNTNSYLSSITNIEYYSDEVPQYVSVRFSTNHNGFYFYGGDYHVHPGTTLWIDDVELIYLNTLSQNLLQEVDVQIYPNPITDHFQVEVPPNVAVQSMQVHDFSGRRVKTLNPQSRFHSMIELPSGMYFLTLHTDQGSVVKKLVKE